MHYWPIENSFDAYLSLQLNNTALLDDHTYCNAYDKLSNSTPKQVNNALLYSYKLRQNPLTV